MKKAPPYEGDEPYLYFAFADGDRSRVWKLMRLLVNRGCRVWYSVGPAGSAEELLRRQRRAGGAALTLLYLTDAACADQDIKSSVLVNQKYGRPILCLDPDGADRRLKMGLRESVPHVPLYEHTREEDLESAIIRAEGFSQDIIGEPGHIDSDGYMRTLTRTFLVLALILAVTAFVGVRYFHWFQPKIVDEVTFSDPVILAAMRRAAGGGSITEELASSVTLLSLDGIPEDWEELSELPALERIRLPQDAVTADTELPEEYIVELSGGNGK